VVGGFFAVVFIALSGKLRA